MPEDYYIDVELDEFTLRQLLLILRETEPYKLHWARSTNNNFFGEFVQEDLSIMIYTKNEQPERLVITSGRLRATVVYYVQVQAVRYMIEALMDMLNKKVTATSHNLTYTIQDLL